MSSVRTAIAPSFAGGGGGGSGVKRGRDGGDGGDDRRRPGKPKPTDKISAADFGPEGRIRQLILMLLQLANLGDLPSGSLLTRGGQPKTLSERSTAVGRWVEGQLHASAGLVQAKYRQYLLGQALPYPSYPSPVPIGEHHTMHRIPSHTSGSGPRPL